MLLKLWRGVKSLVPQPEKIVYDVLIIGAGPAGLATGIKLKQLVPELSVCVLEKSTEVGDHLLSGGCFEPRALDELIPDWRFQDAPIHTQVSSEEYRIITNKKQYKIPKFMLPRSVSNTGNYIINLSETAKWLSEYAESLGVQIFEGIPVSSIIYDPRGFVTGVTTSEFGRNSKDQQKDVYRAGIEIYASQTVFAEGSRGYLSQELINRFNLDKYEDEQRTYSNQVYSLGFKELWTVKHQNEGKIIHIFSPEGRGHLYYQSNDQVHVGFTVSLNYSNPYFSPFDQFQQFKLQVKEHLENGECIGYGAKTISDGGFFSVPKLTVPGGLIVGCAAGFYNSIKGKGIHTAMKSGMLAAESLAQAISPGKDINLYNELYTKSWIWEELYAARDFKASFSNSIWAGLFYTHFFYNFQQQNTVNLHISKRGTQDQDANVTEFAKNHSSISYPSPDGKITFTKDKSLELSGIVYEEDQPNHLKFTKNDSEVSLQMFRGIEERICPTGVFRWNEEGLDTVPARCIHCKACDIKSPSEYIKWTPPEYGGPIYKM